MDNEPGEDLRGDGIADGEEGSLDGVPAVANTLAYFLGDAVEGEVNPSFRGARRARWPEGEALIGLLEDPGAPLVDALRNDGAEVGAFRPMHTRRGNADYCALDPQVRELVEETLRGGARGGDTQ